MQNSSNDQIPVVFHDEEGNRGYRLLQYRVAKTTAEAVWWPDGGHFGYSVKSSRKGYEYRGQISSLEGLFLFSSHHHRLKFCHWRLLDGFDMLPSDQLPVRETKRYRRTLESAVRILSLLEISVIDDRIQERYVEFIHGRRYLTAWKTIFGSVVGNGSRTTDCPDPSTAPPTNG